MPSRVPAVIVAVALGGALGSVARWVAEVVAVPALGQLAWATLLVNVAGCFLMGVLVSVILRGALSHSLARPFLGTGFLGGFTTFSAYTVDAVVLTREGAPLLAATYLVVTILACLLAVWVGTRLGRVGVA